MSTYQQRCDVIPHVYCNILTPVCTLYTSMHALNNCYTCIYMQTLCIYTYIEIIFILECSLFTCILVTTYITISVRHIYTDLLLRTMLKLCYICIYKILCYFFLGGGCYKLHFIRQVDRFKSKKKKILRHQTEKNTFTAKLRCMDNQINLIRLLAY